MLAFINLSPKSIVIFICHRACHDFGCVNRMISIDCWNRDWISIGFLIGWNCRDALSRGPTCCCLSG